MTARKTVSNSRLEWDKSFHDDMYNRTTVFRVCPYIHVFTFLCTWIFSMHRTLWMRHKVFGQIILWWWTDEHQQQTVDVITSVSVYTKINTALTDVVNLELMVEYDVMIHRSCHLRPKPETWTKFVRELTETIPPRNTHRQSRNSLFLFNSTW